MPNNELHHELMNEFSEQTGVTSEKPPRRYLWTDAFAVCNYLGLETNDPAGGNQHKPAGGNQVEIAKQLVDQVHHVLGRHREDDPRSGWISGLDESDGERAPTRGGLRIGKPSNEPPPEQPEASDSHWNQDGQYFHYLTKWMHALYEMASVTNQPHYLRWAKELAETTHKAFVFEAPDGSKRMVWKMSIDLSRPLVTSMGHHDPLDGLITFMQLQHASAGAADDGPDLQRAIDDMSDICEGTRWCTDDSLGIGGLLADAAKLGHLVFAHHVDRLELLQHLLLEAEVSLQSFARSAPMSRPSQYRLAFRELGLSIGMRAMECLRQLSDADPQTAGFVDRLLEHKPMADWIESFWAAPEHRTDETWKAHRDINSVMLATSLAPAGYLKW